MSLGFEGVNGNAFHVPTKVGYVEVTQSEAPRLSGYG